MNAIVSFRKQIVVEENGKKVSAFIGPHDLLSLTQFLLNTDKDFIIRYFIIIIIINGRYIMTS